MTFLKLIITAEVIVQLLHCTVAHGNNPFSDLIQEKISIQRLDNCFCELKGQVDECCCDVETVDILNKNRIYPLISSLLNRTFFKFFRVNLHRTCPFWPDDGKCVLKDCHVEECSEDNLPAYLKDDDEEEPCDAVSEEEMELSLINSTISMEQRRDFTNWQNFDSTKDNFCDIDAESMNGNGELGYVDLHLNPERFTGYSGHSAHRIWKAIYHENCFRPQDAQVHPSLSIFDSSVLQGMCLEKRAFYRIISGIHSSINIHLSSQYLITGGKEAKFGANLNEFVRRFDSATTNGQGPSWLKNLYFGYLLVLRAIVKMEYYWEDYKFYTGNEEEDRETKTQVTQLITAAKSCSSLFDESMMFNDKTPAFLKNEFKLHFKNISVIMDCVGCDKCKLWGRLQVQGVGTALKILFSDHQRDDGPPFYLSRMELVALFNVLGRFSSSIHSLDVFRDTQAKTLQQYNKSEL